MKNNTGYKKIVVLAVIGNYIIELLPLTEGHFFSKDALTLCWKWIEGQKIEIGNLYDCLDSPEGIDFSYYEDIEENQEIQKIYRYLFHIVAYITNQISIIQRINRPQYLDYMDENYFETIIKTITDENEYIKKIAEKAFKYCDNKMLNDTHFPIIQQDMIKEVTTIKK